MDCRGRDYALFRVRTPVILSPRARLGTARVSAYGGQAGGLFPNMAATCWCSGLGGLRLLLVPGLCWSALEWKCLILELGFRLLTSDSDCWLTLFARGISSVAEPERGVLCRLGLLQLGVIGFCLTISSSAVLIVWWWARASSTLFGLKCISFLFILKCCFLFGC